MKIVEFGDDGKPIDRNAIKIVEFGLDGPSKAPRTPPQAAPAETRKPSEIQLYMFQTGTLRTKTKYIKMNQGEESFEIPVPWFLIKHPKGNVVIDGGNAAEVAHDPRGHWGDVLAAYMPVMDPSENCVAQCASVGVAPDQVRYVVQSHLHLDHTGAIGRFPNATHIVQRLEWDYAFDPDWFAKGAYIRQDFDRPRVDWKFLGGEYTDNFDLFGDGTIRMIFTPGHSPGHQSFLVRLPNTGPVLLCIDAAYTMDHWNEKALPGLVCSSVDAARSVRKLRKIAEDTGAMVVTGHDPDAWRSLGHAPRVFYD
jgi:glyoxylase-like metal-dependent hydrolase (beta-lactamase superfamily II)